MFFLLKIMCYFIKFFNFLTYITPPCFFLRNLAVFSYLQAHAERRSDQEREKCLVNVFLFTQTDFPLNRFMDFRTISVTCPDMLKYGA